MSVAVWPARPELVLSRVFDAPPALVFRAWTDPAQIAIWWGPHMFTNPVVKADVRPGGELRIVMRGPDGTDYPMRGIYREVVEPSRLVFDAMLDGPGGELMLETRNTVTLTEDHGKTRLEVHVRVLRATDAAAGPLSGMNEGWSQQLERLTAFITERSTR